MIRVPSPLLDLQRKMKRHESLIRLHRSPECSDFELAEAVVEGVEEMDDLRRSLNADVSCEARVGSYEDLTVGERLTYDDELDPIDEIDRGALREKLFDALNVLPERSRHTIEGRFGLIDGEPRTLAEVGEEIGVSRERVRQIEKHSLGVLRENSEALRLADAS